MSTKLFKAITLGEDKKVPTHVQLLRTGVFSYDDIADLPITRDTLLSFVDNFNDKVRGYEDGQLPIDYFHEGHKIAAGWIFALHLKEKGEQLWADVKWTDRAEQMISTGELRYLSVEFNENYVGNESEKQFGPTLLGAGLTNRPFVKGMKAVVQFSDRNGGKSTMTPEQIKAMQDENARLTAANKELADKTAKQEADAKALADKTAKDAAEAAKKANFDKMMSDGKACEAQRDAFMAGDMVKFAELAKPLNTEGHGNSGDGDDEEEGEEGETTTNFADSKTPAQDEILEKAKKLSEEKKIPLSQAISNVLKSDKKLREGYNKEVKLG